MKVLKWSSDTILVKLISQLMLDEIFIVNGRWANSEVLELLQSKAQIHPHHAPLGLGPTLDDLLGWARFPWRHTEAGSFP